MDKKEQKILDDMKDLLLDKLAEATKKGVVALTDAKGLGDVMELLMKLEDYKDCCESKYDEADGSFLPRRNSRNGRFMSGTHNGYHGYSGHSIEDRMIDSLERMYDSAGGEHEKEVISEWIRKIRNS